MKNFITTIILGASVTACGMQDATSTVKEQKAPQETAIILEGIISEVRNEAATTGMGMWTEIDVEYLVPCTQTFKEFSHSVKMVDGAVKVYASALATSLYQPGEMQCLAFSHHVETINIGGLVSADQVELINLKGSNKKVAVDTIGINKIQAVHTVDTAPLCPEGSVCSKDGTILKLGVNMSCVNSLGPLAYTVDSQENAAGEMQHVVNLAAFEFVHKDAAVVMCAAVLSEIVISLPMIYGDADSFTINLLK